MIEKIENNPASDILKEQSSRISETSKGSANNQTDASLQISSNSLVEKAKQVPTEDANAVQQARQLLLSGKLDTPENIRAAAESIVKFGV
ncbi:MAG: hypothetical protein CVV39_00970 [Planctomycetes bacterium HGW-Planctomycetes-1]|nr:MAG: hypothetical protein CVV39_00970 [Planctomycetes bacterium HGW-Planctomycetes-1]